MPIFRLNGELYCSLKENNNNCTNRSGKWRFKMHLPMLQDKPRCTDLSPLHTRILRFHLTSGKRNSYLAPRDISFFLLRLELAFFIKRRGITKQTG